MSWDDFGIDPEILDMWYPNDSEEELEEHLFQLLVQCMPTDI